MNSTIKAHLWRKVFAIESSPIPSCSSIYTCSHFSSDLVTDRIPCQVLLDDGVTSGLQISHIPAYIVQVLEVS